MEREILAHMKGLPAWGLGALGTIAVGRASQLVDEFRKNPLVAALGIVNTDGTVEIDVLYNAVKKQAERSDATIEFNVMGVSIGTLKLTAKDVDALYQYIKDSK